MASLSYNEALDFFRAALTCSVLVWTSYYIFCVIKRPNPYPNANEEEKDHMRFPRMLKKAYELLDLVLLRYV
jgi:hypothetical protein